MFTNIFFLILALILISLGVDSTLPFPQISPFQSFIEGLALYAITLGIIAIQNLLASRKKQSLLLKIANIELLVFLCIYHFLLSSQRFFYELPVLGSFLVVPTIVSVALYLGGLLFFHWTAKTRRGFKEIRFLIPFTIPFILFTIIIDIADLIPENYFNSFVGVLFLVLFVVLTLIFLPYVIQKVWKCEKLDDALLVDRLELLCKKAHFKYAAMKTFPVMNTMPTAAIIGVIPQLRYVLFTEKLLRQLPPEEIEAVLAHEIGHSKHKHLLLYPYIFSGMIVLMILFGIFSPLASIFDYFARHDLELLSPLLLFVAYGLIFALYFRFVMGFFSRLFERQADLYVSKLHIPIQYMIEALDRVGVATGNSHSQPNWHHYSIQERIDFLEKVKENSALVKSHDRLVRIALAIYTLLLVLGIGIILWMTRI